MGNTKAGMTDIDPALALFNNIGSFLQAHRLGPEPINYEFAYRVASNPTGPLAVAVRNLTEGGIRLTRKDIIALGGEVAAAAANSQDDADAADERRTIHDSLVAQTQMQVEGFADLVRAVHAETTGFGRDLAAQAQAMRDTNSAGSGELAQLTGSMVKRVQSAETRLEAATREAAELREKLDEARDNARRDPLTGLPNRRAFEEAYVAALSSGKALCLAVCDIDKFKLVNDGFGHAVGDRVLKAIGDVINAECRGHMVARYGGEEFTILFIDQSAAEAHEMLEVARATVANKRYRLRETDVPLGAVTFSAGLTAAITGEALDSVFERADALLYRAKDEGRNRIYID
jgi:diguanylate cyclase